MKQSGPRHLGREYALRLVYADLFMQRMGEEAIQPFLPITWYGEDNLHVTFESEDFGKRLFRGVQKHREQIDDIIRKQAHHWKLERITNVDRVILQLAVYELQYEEDTSTSVILNEALELAKCYGSEDSSRFINGVLDPIAHYIRGEQSDAESKDTTNIET